MTKKEFRRGDGKTWEQVYNNGQDRISNFASATSELLPSDRVLLGSRESFTMSEYMDLSREAVNEVDRQVRMKRLQLDAMYPILPKKITY
jgi:hypothetical protein